MESVRKGYEKLGVDNYYKIHSNDYVNPHFEIIKNLLEDYLKTNNIGNNILDLCCGSGEVTTILKSFDERYQIVGLDPYLYNTYHKNTNNECLSFDFKDIVCGKLKQHRYDTIICSFAMHLCEESMLNSLLYQLSLVTNNLIIITPHKRPDIHNWFVLKNEYTKDRVRLRIYKKIVF